MNARMYRLDNPGASNGFLRDIADKLFRRKRQIFVWLSVWTATMGLYVWLQPRSYEGEIRFLVRNNRVGLAVTPETNSGPLYRDYVDETAIATEIQVLSNDKLLRAVVDTCQLAEGKDAESQDRALRSLRKDLKIGPVLKANMIKARYTSKNPKEVEAVLRQLSEGYMSEHLRAHSAEGAHDVFDNQALFYEQRLKDLQGQLTDFETKRDIVVLGQQKDLSIRHRQDLEVALKAARTARLENVRKMSGLADQLASHQPRITTQSRQVPNQYSIERLNTMLVELQNRQTQLLSKFQPGDRLVNEVRKQITDTQTALSRASAAISTEHTSDVNPIRQSIEAELGKARVNDAEFETRIRSLELQVGESRKSLDLLRDSTSEEDHLLRQIKEAEANYFLYSKKREDARIEAAMDRQRISNVVLIEPPKEPIVPMPLVSMTTAGAYVLGCLLIIGLQFALSVFDQRVYTAWELEGLTGIPVLAVVPSHALSLRIPHNLERNLSESRS